MGRPFRYTLILGLVAIGTALAAVGGWRYARASAPVNGPIVLISIDTLRADHLPIYGYTHGRAPNIDALAADGIVFERAYSHVPQTLPAHVALLSGRLPFETGVRDNVGFAVKRDERMLPQMLRDRGYTTGGVVSAYVLRKDTGINRGFDFFDAWIHDLLTTRSDAMLQLNTPGLPFMSKADAHAGPLKVWTRSLWRSPTSLNRSAMRRGVANADTFLQDILAFSRSSLAVLSRNVRASGRNRDGISSTPISSSTFLYVTGVTSFRPG